MTLIICQRIIYITGSRAACRVPAPRVAVPASTASTLLKWQFSTASGARQRFGNVRHGLPWINFVGKYRYEKL
jgi:hypothetical protein